MKALHGFCLCLGNIFKEINKNVNIFSFLVKCSVSNMSIYLYEFHEMECHQLRLCQTKVLILSARIFDESIGRRNLSIESIVFDLKAPQSKNYKNIALLFSIGK